MAMSISILHALLILACLCTTFSSISANSNYNVFFLHKKGDSDSEKNINVVVESMVYCQSCDLVGSSKVSYDNPINGATVSVLCNDAKNNGSYYKTFETDQNGFLYAELKGFTISKDELILPLKSCYLRLVASPNVFCDFPTNVNYLLNGSPFRFQNKSATGRHYRAEIYAAGPLAFRPARCVSSDAKP